MATLAPIKPQILIWARELNNLTHTQLAEKINVHENVIEKWESAQTMPTYKQSEDLARALRIPHGYLFLSTPPKLEDPLPDLRTLSDKPLGAISVDLREVLYSVLDIQDWYREYRLEFGAEKLPFVASFALDSKPQEIASSISRTLRIDAQTRASVNTWSKYLTKLTERAESAGVLVMHSGVVGNSKTRKLDVEEFEGFVAVDDLAPVIFVNSNDYIAARIFTLAHELAHIWIGKSAIVNPDEADVPLPASNLESLCNAVAAECLVPKTEFLTAYDSYNGSIDDLSRYFRVSRIVVLRRAFEFKKISRDQFFGTLTILQGIRRGKKRGGKGGGPLYEEAVALRHSPTFMDSIIKDARVGGTMIRDAARLLHMPTASFSRVLEIGEY